MLLSRLPRALLYITPALARGGKMPRPMAKLWSSRRLRRIYSSKYHEYEGMVAYPPCKIQFNPYTPVAHVPTEPDIPIEPEIPSYELVNLRIRGYDFVVLESFQGYVHKTCKRMAINVGNSWITPARTSKVKVFKPGTDVPVSEFHLSFYERNVQLPELPATTAVLLMDVLQSNLPEGVNLTLKYHDVEDETIRYIPDLELKALQEQLNELEDPKRKKAWEK